MSRFSSKIEADQEIEISWGDRWQVYRRLQELEIPCQCRTNQPLRYQIQDVAAAIQLWSVVRQLTVPRRELASWLEHCWQIWG
ncbi:Asr1405/Asl0597 family protein [Allocoleopsis sp.]|uniref:Asr1405/Asl0597 family protein n=1 Tax=Allocoleopsis sp. TaxID=3088169 RepID=UPI002FD4A1B6